MRDKKRVENLAEIEYGLKQRVYDFVLDSHEVLLHRHWGGKPQIYKQSSNVVKVNKTQKLIDKSILDNNNSTFAPQLGSNNQFAVQRKRLWHVHLLIINGRKEATCRGEVSGGSLASEKVPIHLLLLSQSPDNEERIFKAKETDSTRI